MTETSLDGAPRGARKSLRRQDEAPHTRGRDTAALDAAQEGKPSWFILIFVLSLVLPNIFFVGPLKLSAYKLILVVLTIPLLGMWAAGRAGKTKSTDFLVFGFSAWSFLALFVVHGTTYVETAGIRTLETVGAYLIARVFIKTPGQFLFMVKCLCWAVVLMLPFAVIEAATSRIMINEIMGSFTGVNPDNQNEMRFGLHRVQGPFEHPILFGVFCASMTAPAIMIWGYKSGKGGRALKVGVIGMATFLSLSVGAYISAIIQAGLLIWDRILNRVPARWTIAFMIFLFIYVSIDLLSNRSPIQVFISYLTFNSGASYNRILIWKYGTDEVMRHPLFGIGLNDWVRPPWMVASIDNFWLLTTMTYGVPAFVMLIAAFINHILALGRLDFSGSPMMRSYRLAYLIGIGGFMLSLCTVHVWNATYVFLIFMLGSGVWMRDYVVPRAAGDGPGDPEDEGEDDGPPAPRYQSARTLQPRSAPRSQRTPRTARPERPPRPSRTR